MIKEGIELAAIAPIRILEGVHVALSELTAIPLAAPGLAVYGLNWCFGAFFNTINIIGGILEIAPQQK